MFIVTKKKPDDFIMRRSGRIIMIFFYHLILAIHPPTFHFRQIYIFWHLFDEKVIINIRILISSRIILPFVSYGIWIHLCRSPFTLGVTITKWNNIFHLHLIILVIMIKPVNILTNEGTTYRSKTFSSDSTARAVTDRLLVNKLQLYPSR